MTLTCVGASQRGNCGLRPSFESVAAFSSKVYITLSIAPLGELCNMIGFFGVLFSSTNSIPYLLPFSTSI